MSKTLRLIALAAIALIPVGATASSALAQKQYEPAPNTLSETATESLVVQLAKLDADALFGSSTPVSLTITTGAPGKYEIKISGRLPGKKSKILTAGSITVAAGASTTTSTVSVTATGSGKTLNKKKNKAKFAGKIPVKVTITYTSPAGQTSTTTLKTSIAK